MLTNLINSKPFLVLVLVLMLTGCAQPTAPSVTASPEPAPTLTATSPTAEEPILDTPSPPTYLRLWVPPEFDPANETRAGRLLQARLDEFTERDAALIMKQILESRFGYDLSPRLDDIRPSYAFDVTW